MGAILAVRAMLTLTIQLEQYCPWEQYWLCEQCCLCERIKDGVISNNFVKIEPRAHSLSILFTDRIRKYTDTQHTLVKKCSLGCPGSI